MMGKRSNPAAAAVLLLLSPLLATAMEQYPVNMCSSYGNLCTSFLGEYKCTDPVNVVGCEGPTGRPSYESYAGRCECGGLNATRLEQGIIYHEIWRQHALQSLLAPNAAPAEATTDFCASHTNTCNAFLNAVSCPVALQVNQGCTVPGDLTTFTNQCSCGGIDGSLEARNSIIELVTPAKEVNALTVYEKESETYLQLCPTFSNLCGSFLDDIACPEEQRLNVGCLKGNDYETYQGQCQCGGVDAGDRVRRLVIDAHIGPKIAMISDSFVFTDGSLDFCNAFSWSCNEWTDVIQCPTHMIVNKNNCGSASGTEIQNFQGTCTCGDIMAHQRIQDIIIDVQMADALPNLLCGLNGACKPIKEIVLVRSKISGGGVVGLLLTCFVIVILTGAFLPGLWTFCNRGGKGN